MSRLSDIEELEENSESRTNGDMIVGSILVETRPNDSSYSTNITGDSNSDASTRAYKSTASLSVKLSVDNTVLQLVKEIDDDASLKSRSTFLCDCCDLLRTCLIVDIIYVVFLPAFLAFHVNRYSTVNSAELEDFVDDQFFDDDDGFVDVSAKMDVQEYYSLEYFILIIKNVLEILFPAVGIYGVCKFNKVIVLAVAIFFVVDFIVSAILERWTVVVIVAFVSAIHFSLFRVLRNGNISPAQYPNESVCCCGGKNDDDDDDEED